MATKKRGLGRNLNALLGDFNSDDEVSVAATPKKKETLRHVSVDKLKPCRYQPRKDIQQEGLDELANSIRAQGLIQPIVVQTKKDGMHEIIAGERRWRAARMANLSEVPVVVREASDHVVMAMALIENIQREDLNPVEEALALKRLSEEFQLTHQEVAETVGRSRAGISNLLRLLQLEPKVLRMLENGDIEMGHARALLSLDGDTQVKAADAVIARSLSVRETENMVRLLQGQKKPTIPAKPMDPNLATRQQSFAERLDTKVAIKQGKGKGGKIVIQYKDLEQLDGILNQVAISQPEELSAAQDAEPTTGEHEDVPSRDSHGFSSINFDTFSHGRDERDSENATIEKDTADNDDSSPYADDVSSEDLLNS